MTNTGEHLAERKDWPNYWIAAAGEQTFRLNLQHVQLPDAFVGLHSVRGSIVGRSFHFGSSAEGDGHEMDGDKSRWLRQAKQRDLVRSSSAPDLGHLDE